MGEFLEFLMKAMICSSAAGELDDEEETEVEEEE